jgi:hypothetical protein
MPGRPPPGFENRGNDWRRIAGTDDAEWPYVERLPRRWEHKQIKRAYREACRILCKVGLSLSAYETWCWRDPSGAWWALPDAMGGLVPSTTAELRGAWLLPGHGRTPERRAWPAEFIQAFGGPSGPLEWAFWVVDTVRELKRFGMSQRRVAVAELAALTRLPEWAALEAAAGDDPFATSALSQVRQLLDSGGAYATDGAFVFGFELGQGLGEYAVLAAVDAAEARRAKAVEKDEMRATLLEAAKAELAAKGKLQPYTLAKTLIAERGVTERGKRLASLGMPASDNRLGILISEVARKARLSS